MQTRSKRWFRKKDRKVEENCIPNIENEWKCDSKDKDVNYVQEKKLKKCKLIELKLN